MFTFAICLTLILFSIWVNSFLFPSVSPSSFFFQMLTLMHEMAFLSHYSVSSHTPKYCGLNSLLSVSRSLRLYREEGETKTPFSEESHIPDQQEKI